MSHQSQFRALIVGCTGISGSALVSRLIADSEKTAIWAEIVGLSRGPSTRLEVTKRSKKGSFVVRFISADLTTESAQKLADQVGVDILTRISHIFFTAWMPAPQSFDEEFNLNCKMFDNFLNSVILVRQNTSTFPRLILLEGTKSYGIHLGPNKFAEYRVPFDEDAYTRHSTPPNFYYGWDNSLKNRQWPEWIAIRPGPIVGVSVQRSSFYNFGTGFAVLLSLLKSLNRTLTFPNSTSSDKKEALDALHDCVDSKIVAAQLAWVALLPSETLKSKEMLDACGMPALNCSNGAPFKWRVVWPQVAQRIGMKHSLEDSFDMLQFVNDPDVKAHWARMVEQYKLVTPRNLTEVAVWPAVLATLTRPYDCYASLKKVRQFGFTKTISTVDMFVSLIRDLQLNCVIPPVLIS